MHVEPFVLNKTRKSVLATEGRILRSTWRMALGAMFVGLRGKALVFVWWKPDTIAITNLFVFESIDILWLDSKGKVVALHEGFAPWSLHASNQKPALYVVELPAGTIKASRTRIGDVVTVQDSSRNLFKT